MRREPLKSPSMKGFSDVDDAFSFGPKVWHRLPCPTPTHDMPLTLYEVVWDRLGRL